MKFTLDHADQNAIQLAALKWPKRSMSGHGGQHLGLTFSLPPEWPYILS